jgi:hypothetical protein
MDESKDRYASRRQRRTARRAARAAGGWNWIGGALLVGLGLLLLLQNAGYFTDFANWWALFILLPASGSFSAALRVYRNNGGEWTREALAPAAAGVIFTALALVFLFGLDLNLFGPVLLIAGGLLLIVGRH